MDFTNISHYADRVAAYREAVAEHALESDPELLVTGIHSFREGSVTTRRLLASLLRPTALVCGSDTLAIGAMSAAFEAGVDIPHQLSVTGYGDAEIAAFTRPALTSINGSKEALGPLAVQILLRRLQKKSNGAKQPRDQSYVLPVELMVRGSTSAAP